MSNGSSTNFCYLSNDAFSILKPVDRKIILPRAISLYPTFPYSTLKGECSVFKKKIIIDENDALSEYNKIPLGHNRTNGAVYSKIYFKVEICCAH